MRISLICLLLLFLLVLLTSAAPPVQRPKFKPKPKPKPDQDDPGIGGDDGDQGGGGAGRHQSKKRKHTGLSKKEDSEDNITDDDSNINSNALKTVIKRIDSSDDSVEGAHAGGVGQAETMFGGRARPKIIDDDDEELHSDELDEDGHQSAAKKARLNNKEKGNKGEEKDESEPESEKLKLRKVKLSTPTDELGELDADQESMQITAHNYHQICNNDGELYRYDRIFRPDLYNTAGNPIPSQWIEDVEAKKPVHMRPPARGPQAAPNSPSPAIMQNFYVLSTDTRAMICNLCGQSFVKADAGNAKTHLKGHASRWTFLKDDLAAPPPTKEEKFAAKSRAVKASWAKRRAENPPFNIAAQRNNLPPEAADYLASIDESPHMWDQLGNPIPGQWRVHPPLRGPKVKRDYPDDVWNNFWMRPDGTVACSYCGGFGIKAISPSPLDAKRHLMGVHQEFYSIWNADCPDITPELYGKKRREMYRRKRGGDVGVIDPNTLWLDHKEVDDPKADPARPMACNLHRHRLRLPIGTKPFKGELKFGELPGGKECYYIVDDAEHVFVERRDGIWVLNGRQHMYLSRSAALYGVHAGDGELPVGATSIEVTALLKVNQVDSSYNNGQKKSRITELPLPDDVNAKIFHKGGVSHFISNARDKYNAWDYDEANHQEWKQKAEIEEARIEKRLKEIISQPGYLRLVDNQPQWDTKKRNAVLYLFLTGNAGGGTRILDDTYISYLGESTNWDGKVGRRSLYMGTVNPQDRRIGNGFIGLRGLTQLEVKWLEAVGLSMFDLPVARLTNRRTEAQNLVHGEITAEVRQLLADLLSLTAFKARHKMIDADAPPLEDPFVKPPVVAKSPVQTEHPEDADVPEDYQDDADQVELINQLQEQLLMKA